MRQDREPEDLIEVWTLLEDDMKRCGTNPGATRLGCALLTDEQAEAYGKFAEQPVQARA